MLNFDKIRTFHNHYKNTLDKEIINKIREKGIYSACFNLDIINNTKNTFNIELPETKIYNQGDSYLCWIYAFISFMKTFICKKLKIADKNLDLSINYIHFFDRLEKSNILYEKIIHNSLKLEDEINESLLDTYIHTCGSFDNAKEIIQKYGIVPETEMPMNINTFEPSVFNKLFKEKVKTDILEMLNLNTIKEKEHFKEKCLEENYVLLSKVFGQPPIKFNFKYQNIDGNEIALNDITPKEFLKSVFPYDMSQFIFVMSDETKAFYKKFPYYDFEQIYNHKHYFYNLPINKIKDSIIKQLKAGFPVWFGCDFKAVCGSYTNKAGILDSNLFDFKNTLDIQILPKLEQQKFNSCNYDHAMVIVGVQIENDKPIRWKVQNSFGKEHNQKGYFVMNDNYFDEYAIMFGIHNFFIL